jgi:hypothetical protein
VYEAISRMRHGHNHTERKEPEGWDIPGMESLDQSSEAAAFCGVPPRYSVSTASPEHRHPSV